MNEPKARARYLVTISALWPFGPTFSFDDLALVRWQMTTGDAPCHCSPDPVPRRSTELASIQNESVSKLANHGLSQRFDLHCILGLLQLIEVLQELLGERGIRGFELIDRFSDSGQSAATSSGFSN